MNDANDALIAFAAVFLSGCVATTEHPVITETKPKSSHLEIGVISPIKAVRLDLQRVSVSVSVTNVAQGTLCVGGLSPLAAHLANGIPASDMFLGAKLGRGDNVIALLPGGIYTWRERFEFMAEAGDTVVMGGTELQNRAAREELARGVASGIVEFSASVPVFECEVTIQKSKERAGYILVNFDETIRLSETAHLKAGSVRLSGFR